MNLVSLPFTIPEWQPVWRHVCSPPKLLPPWYR